MKLRFRKALRAEGVLRGPTDKRVAAAIRFLAKEPAKLPLFPELQQEIIESQPTPEERIWSHDHGVYLNMLQGRIRRAHNWRRARWLLANMAERDRTILVDYWNRCGQPADPEFLLGHISRFFADCQKRIDAGERWHVFNPYDDKLTVLLWHPDGAAKIATKVAGPFDDYLEAIEAMKRLVEPAAV